MDMYCSWRIQSLFLTMPRPASVYLSGHEMLSSTVPENMFFILLCKINAPRNEHEFQNISVIMSWLILGAFISWHYFSIILTPNSKSCSKKTSFGKLTTALFISRFNIECIVSSTCCSVETIISCFRQFFVLFLVNSAIFPWSRVNLKYSIL